MGKGKYEIAFSDNVTLHQTNVYKMIQNLSEKKGYIINNPFERYSDGKLKAYGEQPEGKMDIPFDEYVELQKNG